MSSTIELKNWNLGIHYGCLADSIEKQINDGWPEELEKLFPAPSEGQLEHFQLDADAISRLRVRAILSEGEVHKALTRLQKDIKEFVLSYVDTKLGEAGFTKKEKKE